MTELRDYMELSCICDRLSQAISIIEDIADNDCNPLTEEERAGLYGVRKELSAQSNQIAVRTELMGDGLNDSIEMARWVVRTLKEGKE